MKIRSAFPKNPYSFKERQVRYRVAFKVCGNCGSPQVFKYHEGCVKDGIKVYCFTCSAHNPELMSKKKYEELHGTSSWRDEPDAQPTKLTMAQVKKILAAGI